MYKAHYSPRTSRWEICTAANPEACPYGASTEHTQIAGLKELDTLNIITDATNVVGEDAALINAYVDLYNGQPIDDDGVNAMQAKIEELYEDHYALRPHIIAEAAAQPESNVKYLYANGDGSMTIRAGDYYLLSGCTRCFVGNEKLDFNLAEQAKCESDPPIEGISKIDAGLVNGRPTYAFRPNGLLMEHAGSIGTQLVPAEVVDFYGLDIDRFSPRHSMTTWSLPGKRTDVPEDYHPHRLITIDSDTKVFNGNQVESYGFGSGKEYLKANFDAHWCQIHSRYYDKLYDSLQEVDKYGNPLTSVRRPVTDSYWHFDRDAALSCQMAPSQWQGFIDSTERVPDSRYAERVDFDQDRLILHVVMKPEFASKERELEMNDARLTNN